MYAPSVLDRIHGSGPLRRRQLLGRVLARSLANIEVVGAELVPHDGPLVLASNHVDFLDGPVLFGFMPRPVTFLVKAEAFTPRATPYLVSSGQVAVRRDGYDVGPIRFCLRVLRGGGVVGLFPEGARGDGTVREARPGVGYFALRTGARVVPVACHGTDHMTHDRTGLRPRVRVTYGEPIDLGHVPWGQRVSRRQMLEATEQVRIVLAKLVADTALGPA